MLTGIEREKEKGGSYKLGYAMATLLSGKKVNYFFQKKKRRQQIIIRVKSFVVVHIQKCDR